MSYKLKLASWMLVAGVTGLLGCSDGEDALDSSQLAATGAEGGRGDWWREERALRNAALTQYLTDNAEDYAWFKNAPLGNSGVPMIMFRLFPELFPAIWGQPGDHFAPVGLGKNTLEPNRVLPLGMGFTGSNPPIQTAAGPVHIQVAQLTCMACHGGKVVGPSGTVDHVIGAPSTTFNQFRLAITRTVYQPGYTADAFRAALAAKPLGWLYADPAMVRQEALERAIFLSPGAAENFLGGLKAKVAAGSARFAATIGTHTYGDVANAPNLAGSKPGYLDAFGAAMTLVVDPARFSTAAELNAVLPPAPAEIDIMSVWNQSGRPRAQWDGSIKSSLHRNLGAELGVVGNPAALNMENAVRTTRFTERLPSTPYPFNIDRPAAARGQRLYEQACASCHAPGNDDLYTADEIGTDPNRAAIWTPYTVVALQRALQVSCTDPVACVQPDGSPVPAADIISAPGGYMSVPLDGIWARAPYLHNGSVPTLHALVTGVRPTRFYRGNITYDQKNVGFTWDSAGPYAAEFDTTRSGLSNTGHTGTQFLGEVDWANDPAKTADLLEFMKTL